MNTLSLDQLLASLHERNVQIWLDGKDLRYRAPAGALTPELLAQLGRLKPAVVEFLENAVASAPHRPQLGPRPQSSKPPLSFGQERLCFLDQLEPNSAVYNIPVALRLKGALNVTALRRCLEEIVRRHESLRTSFEMVQGQPVHVIQPQASIELPVVELSGLAEAERETEAKRLCTEEAQRPFKLAQDPMLRARLIRVGDEEHIFVLVMHHIASDDWSMGLLVRELKVLYQAFCEDKPSPLPELPIQYADYALWQRDWLQGETLEEQLSYWKKQLAGAPALLELPADRPRPATQSYRGALLLHEMPKALLAALTELSRRDGVSLFMTLLAGFQALLHRYTGIEDVVVGSAIAGRNRAELESLIGFFVNTLVMRGDLSGDPSFRSLLARTRVAALGAYAHQDLPFEKLVEVLQPKRDMCHAPLFQVMFVFQNAPAQAAKLGDVEATTMLLDNGGSKFDLTLSVRERGGLLHAMVEYNTDLFEAETIRRMLGHYQTLLEGIAANPEQRLSELPLLTSGERQQIVVEWNQTQIPYPKDRCLHELIAEQVERTPDAVAVVFEDKQLTYRQLDERASHLARQLAKLGVGPDILVGICVERSLEMVVGMLGILKAGGAYVPLDPNYPKNRLEFMLDDARPLALVTQRKLRDVLPTHQAKVVYLDANEETGAGDQHGTGTESRVRPNCLAYVLYTSGSTGRPKGVAIEHRSAVAFMAWAHRVFTDEEFAGVLFATSMCFDLSVFELFVTLGAGGKVILAENALQLPTLPARSEVRMINTVPSAIAELARTNGIPPSVITVNLAGEPLAQSLVDKLYDDSDVQRVYDLYGPTEATTYSTFTLRRRGGKASIGRPILNTQVYILDRYQRPVPIGVPGELYIGGDGLARGYLNRPELTLERFVPNPLMPEVKARLYKTGDLARYLPDGNIEYLGRLDHQVKIRGFRIELGEIEAQLNQHPAVRESAVMAREDIPGEKSLVSYVVSREGFPSETRELREFLKKSLPEYMVPEAFVFLQVLPLSPNGKVDRRALPAPQKERQTDESYVAPQTDTERRIAAVWQELLGIPRVGVNDSFFELGGNSLRAMKAVFRIHESFNIEITLGAFFENPTVAALAALIDDKKSRQTDVEKDAPLQTPALEMTAMLDVQARERSVPFPLTDIQEAYWIGRGGSIEMGNIGTHLYWEVEIDGLDIVRYEQTWQRLIERHDMLRAIVKPDGQQQILEQAPPFKIKVRDLSGHSPESVQHLLEAAREEMSHQVLPSDRSPMFEIRAFKLGKDSYRLLFSYDALMGDAWSLRVLERECSQLYANPNEELPPLNLSFRDYVLALSKFRESDTFQRSLAYWDERLKTLPAHPDLPLAKSPETIERPHFSRRQYSLEPELWKALKEKAAATGLTANGLLLAVYADVLATWSKRPKLTINLALFNRFPIHPQVDDLVGDFTSTTLLEVDLSGTDTFLGSAKKILGQLWRDLDHRYVSGVQVLRKLAREHRDRATGAAPVVFTSVIGLNDKQFHPAFIADKGKLGYSVSQTPQVWLDVIVVVRNDRLVINWAVVEEMFPPGMIDDMFEAYVSHVRRLATDEKAWAEPGHERIAKLTPKAQLEQRKTINATGAPVAGELLHVLFENQAQRTPQQTAIVSGDVRLTYSELAQMTRKLGRQLREMGAKPNSLVAIVMEKGWEQVVAALSILQSGAAYVPIDSNLPQERLCQLLKNAEVELVLTQPSLDTSLGWPSDVRRLCVEKVSGKQDAAAPLDPVQSPEDLAYVIYTSGSTGLPKGVMIDHRGAVNTIVDLNERFGVSPRDRVLALSSLSFDLSVYDLFGMLAAGGTIVIPESWATRDPVRWMALLQQEGVTIWNSVPALMEMLVEYASGRAEKIPSSLRLVFLSGDWIPVTLPGQIRAISEGIQLMSLGGATEASIWSILYPIENVDPAWKSIPYGRPMVNQSFHVLNELLEPCPVWVPGQLYIGGIGLAKGYWRDEEKTRAKFFVHPKTGERLYSAGDLGRYLPSGDIEFLGREDFQVKVRGFRIELGEVEAAFRQHPAVRSVVATAMGKTTAERQLVAYVVPGREENTDQMPAETNGHATASRLGLEASLKDFIAEKLPVHMIPHSIVIMDALPLTPNGKVDYRSLPKPEMAGPAGRDGQVKPRNEIEEILAGIWREVLRIGAVGIHDDFFSLGGDSVSAIQVISRANKKGYQLLPVLLFRHPTIAELAAKVTAQPATETEGLKTDRVRGREPVLAEAAPTPEGLAEFGMSQDDFAAISKAVEKFSGGE